MWRCRVDAIGKSWTKALHWAASGVWAACSVVAACAASGALAGTGQLTLGSPLGDGPDGRVTVFYPSAAAEQPVRRGPFTLQLAVDAEPLRGNGRLVVLSHGSGGGPWVHSDLARALVQAGYVVAVPWHHADNAADPSRPGPSSWSLRPVEVTQAIDAVAADARLAPLLVQALDAAAG